MTDRQLRIVVDVEDDGTVYASPVFYEDGRILIPSEPRLRGLQVTAQRLTNGYGRWEVAYHGQEKIDHNRARMMAREFDRIEHRMEAIADQVGPPTTFAQFLGRVARALGVELFSVGGAWYSLDQLSELSELFGRRSSA